jgi:hypothetical protein
MRSPTALRWAGGTPPRSREARGTPAAALATTNVWALALRPVRTVARGLLVVTERRGREKHDVQGQAPTRYR